MIRLPDSLHPLSFMPLVADDGSLHCMALWMFVCGAALVWLVMHQKRNMFIRDSRSESEQARVQLAQLLQHSREALYKYNLKNRRFDYLSPACFNQTGYTDREIRAMSLGEFLKRVHPDDRERVRELASGLVRRQQDWEWIGVVEYRFLHKDGEYRSLSDHLYVGYSPEGDAVEVSGSVREVTQISRLEDSLQILERKLQENQKMASLGLLAGGIAHDFNNLMTVVLSNAELALQEQKASAGAMLNEIKRTTLRAAELANQMLVYTGKTTLEVSRIDLSSVVREMGALLEVSISKKVRIRYSFDTELSHIRGDVSQIRQVAMNLITNASEAIGDQSGVIDVSIRETVLFPGDLEQAYPPDGIIGGRYVLMEVSDTGCGMDDQTVHKIFDPLFTTKVNGRGMGMAALLNAVQRHNGVVEVKSCIGKGTVSRVYFHAEGPDESREAPVRTPSRSGWRGHGTALVADDEEAIRMITTTLLERMGFRVVTAIDGLDAIDRYSEFAEEVTCLLLDINMPNLSGSEAAHRIRDINPEIPILFMSGYSREEVMSRFGQQPRADFVKKPFETTALTEALRSVMESSS